MIRKILLNCAIYYVAFKVTQYFKRLGLYFFDEDTFKYFYLQLTVLFTSFLSGKFSRKRNNGLVSVLKPYFIAFVLTIGLISLYFNLNSETKPSRLLISGTLFLGFLVEISWLTFTNTLKKTKSLEFRIKVTPFLIFVKLLIIVVLTGYVYFWHSEGSTNLAKDKIAIGVMFVLWFFAGMFTHQFNSFRNGIRFWVFQWKHIKGDLLFTALVSFMVFILEPEGLSNLNPIIIAISYSIASFIVLTVYFFEKSPINIDVPTHKIIKANYFDEEPLAKQVSKNWQVYKIENGKFNHYLAEQLSNIYLLNFKEIFKFIEESIDIYSFDLRRAIILRSSDTYNVDVLPKNMIEFYLNLHEINDMRRINEFFIKINSVLINGGVFIGCVEPATLRRSKFLKEFPFYLANFFYSLDYLWRRVFPKIPYLQKIYFSITNGKNRVISLSEVLGRLYYCGFEVINIKQLEEKVYFIVKKEMEPSHEKNPSYGLFIKLKRVGKGGKFIYVYKFRTMSPYSEFIQKFIFEKIGSTSGDKVDNDFRVTSWGKVLRRFWIDELPMIVNLIKGDLSLVGVRPLSVHKFEMYPEDFRNERKKYRPGLIPPYYYDLPKSFDKLVESERNYLERYSVKPFSTQIKYLFGALYNIVFKRARSK
ncbi:MAG: hypothetical protein A2440_06565 [Stygiobacter sp. RIFOXYC2_FULL_38_25]|nr:MAG: hypothetical protein A2237_05380 [Stygiobacter sp. RIFOXYA2_FULL_38_8]OGV15007.1 MAG: hypothetical protein A2440_06565 [Stygiobacter sp. RIFOXYC2_FULL_38_25]